MTVSSSGGSCGRCGGLPGPVVARQYPQDVDEAAGQGDHGLGVALSFRAFALAEDTGWAVGFRLEKTAM